MAVSSVMTDTAQNKTTFFQWLVGLDTRLVELILSWILLTRGLMLLTHGDTLNPVTYEAFVNIMPSPAWGLLYFGLGSLIFSGIVINGRWRHSPYSRICGALFSAILFAAVAGLFSTTLSPVPALLYWNLTMISLWNFFVLYSRL